MSWSSGWQHLRCATSRPQECATEELPNGQHGEAMEDAKPERKLGIEGWRAALTAWQHQGTALLASHSAKARAFTPAHAMPVELRATPTASQLGHCIKTGIASTRHVFMPVSWSTHEFVAMRS